MAMALLSNSKIVLVPAGADVLPPAMVNDMDHDWVAVASSEGHLLFHHIAELPQMPKGKGVKIINIPSAKLKSGDESASAITVINEDDSLVIYSGKRHKVLKPEDMEHFEGERAQRGHKLPQGFRSVERMTPDNSE